MALRKRTSSGHCGRPLTAEPQPPTPLPHDASGQPQLASASPQLGSSQQESATPQLGQPQLASATPQLGQPPLKACPPMPQPPFIMQTQPTWLTMQKTTISAKTCRVDMIRNYSSVTAIFDRGRNRRVTSVRRNLSASRYAVGHKIVKISVDY